MKTTQSEKQRIYTFESKEFGKFECTLEQIERLYLCACIATDFADRYLCSVGTHAYSGHLQQFRFNMEMFICGIND